MLKSIFISIAFLHGLIHSMGFAIAFDFANISQLTNSISRATGSFWLIAGLMFIAAIILFLLKKGSWPFVALSAVLISQLLIVGAWQDAKLGTIPNLILFLVAMAGVTNWKFERTYKKDVEAALGRTASVKNSLFEENDMEHLPSLVKKYLRYTGVVGKPKVSSMRMVFDGEMRSRKKSWFRFRSEQHNFFGDPTRLFFMKAQLFGMKVPGYHAYKNGLATMQIKLFGLFPVVNVSGKDLDKGETVTLFNDLCLFAPAALIDKRIKWEAVDNESVKAILTNKDITVSAVLYFIETGQLTNFVSDDRYETGDKQYYRFSTPVRSYKNINGYNLPTYGETVWHYPQGDFTYGRFNLKSIKYNCR
jgi:hypothetical protein